MAKFIGPTTVGGQEVRRVRYQDFLENLAANSSPGEGVVVTSNVTYSYSFSYLSDGQVADDTSWTVFPIPGPVQGVSNGYTSANSPATAGHDINKLSFSSDTDSISIGSLTVARAGGSGQSSRTHGYSSGGITPFGHDNTIDKFPFSSDTDAADVGELAITLRASAGHSSSTDGYTSGGSNPPNIYNTIQKFPFSADTPATSSASLGITSQFHSGHSSPTHGYTAGNFPVVNTIRKFPFASSTTGTSVGSMTTGKHFVGGSSSDTHGYVLGGATSPSVFTSAIEKFPFATNTNSVNTADLIGPIRASVGVNSTVSGYSTGGNYGTVIQKFPFSSDAPASSVGVLTSGKQYGAGNQV